MSERLRETAMKLREGWEAPVMKEMAFQETGPGGADETGMLEGEEVRVAAAVVVWGGNVEEAMVQMGMEREKFLGIFQRGHVLRCVAWMSNNRRQVRFALIRRSVEEALLKYPNSWLASEEVPPETKRKILHDLMEADALFPKGPTGEARTMVQVNVVMPEWKKEIEEK